MKVLTDDDLANLSREHGPFAFDVYRAVEAAVIRKLAAVVEPAYLMSPDGKCYAPSKPPLSAGNAKGTLLTLYTATAIAAARVPWAKLPWSLNL